MRPWMFLPGKKPTAWRCQLRRMEETVTEIIQYMVGFLAEHLQFLTFPHDQSSLVQKHMIETPIPAPPIDTLGVVASVYYLVATIFSFSGRLPIKNKLFREKKIGEASLLHTCNSTRGRLGRITCKQ